MQQKTDDETAAFRKRKAVWMQTHMEPVISGIEAFATKAGRGNPPEARKFLRDHAGSAAIIAKEALGVMVTGATKGDSLTALSSNVGHRVAKTLGVKLADEGRAIQVGMALVSIIGDTTGAASIVDMHGDRPEKVAGGVKLTPTYELRITKGQFLADAVTYGAVGMPTFAKNGPAPWTSQEAGGVLGQDEYGMVHGAAKQMKDCTPDTAPALYDAINTAQRARFRINKVTGAVLTAYDAAKAQAWLAERFVAQGMTPDDAKRAAREAARL